MSKAQIGNQITYKKNYSTAHDDQHCDFQQFGILFSYDVTPTGLSGSLRHPLLDDIPRHRPRQFYPSLRTTWQGRRAIREERDEVPAHLSGGIHASVPSSSTFVSCFMSNSRGSSGLDVKPRTAPHNDFSLSWERSGKGATKAYLLPRNWGNRKTDV